MTLLDGIWNWLDDNCLHLNVTKRNDKYCVYLSDICGKPVWVYRDGGSQLIKTYGETIEEAIVDMALKYDGHRLVVYYDDKPSVCYNFPILIKI